MTLQNYTYGESYSLYRYLNRHYCHLTHLHSRIRYNNNLFRLKRRFLNQVEPHPQQQKRSLNMKQQEYNKPNSYTLRSTFRLRYKMIDMFPDKKAEEVEEDLWAVDLQKVLGLQ